MTALVAEPSGDQALPEETEATRPPRPSHQFRLLFLALVYTPLAAVACNLVLEYSVWRGLDDSFLRVFTYSYGWVFGSVVLWVVLMLLVCLTNRLWLSIGLLFSACVGIAAVNQAKLGIRAEPLYPSDLDFLRTPRFLLEMVSPGQLAAAVAGIATIIAGSVWAGRRADRRFRRVRRGESPRLWWWLLIARVLVGALCALLLVATTSFNQPGNGWRMLYESKGPAWRFWYQWLNYQDNGFVGGFLYNMPVTAMPVPEGYSSEAMDEIVARYTRRAARINADRDPAALAKANVVLVLSESFTDPTQLQGFELAEDPLPRFRERQSGAVSGQMLAQLYGGGTANMEFEALTGQSLALFSPQMQTPYQMLVPTLGSYPSAVDWLTRQGYRAIAVHPFLTEMYKRSAVYSVLGFDEFVHDTTMSEQHRLGRSSFISDESAFGEVIRQIEASEEPLLVNLVTMQNHVPFSDTYDDPVEVTGVDAEQAEVIGQYARGLRYTDDALAGFLDDAAASSEPTVVIFYGDHHPGIYEDSVLGRNSDLDMVTTPFMVWSTEGNSPERRTLTSPTHFLPMAFDALGAPIPPYYALLDRLQGQVPAMEQGKFVTSDGDVVAEGELSESARQVLHDMRLVQYDLSIGKRYSAEGLWTAP